MQTTIIMMDRVNWAWGINQDNVEQPSSTGHFTVQAMIDHLAVQGGEVLTFRFQIYPDNTIQRQINSFVRRITKIADARGLTFSAPVNRDEINFEVIAS